MYRKLVLASGLGAVMGALIVPNLWLGVLAGGMIGYLAFDWRSVVGAFRTIWRGVVSRDFKKTFQSSMRFMKRLIYLWAVFGAICLHLFPLIFLSRDGYTHAAVGFLSVVVSVTGIGSLLCNFYTFRYSGDEQWENEICKSTALKCNPIAVYCYYLPKYLLWSMRQIPVVARFTSIFLLRFLRLIHSDMRLVAAFGGAFGAGMGYLLSNPLYGAVIGALIACGTKFVLDRTLISKVAL